MPPLIDLRGQRIGRLTIIDRAPAAGRPAWLCRCDCGSEINVRSAQLLHSRRPTRSCGCLRAEIASINGATFTHGHARRLAGWGTPEFLSWKSMLQRCLNPKATGFDRYGGCGIRVCERWLSFENFLADMGSRPPERSLDRFPDKCGNYEPGNVRWATRAQQRANRRSPAEINAAIEGIQDDEC